jgi:hypothetical protein
MIEDINNLDLMFNKMQGETEMLVKEARENYISTLNNFEVHSNLIKKCLLFFFHSNIYIFLGIVID